MEKPGADRRTALLETCFDVFCQHGLENTGLKLLADACGVTNGALLYHFGSKDNIVIESTAHCMAKVEAQSPFAASLGVSTATGGMSPSGSVPAATAL